MQRMPCIGSPGTDSIPDAIAPNRLRNNMLPRITSKRILPAWIMRGVDCMRTYMCPDVTYAESPPQETEHV